PARSVTISSQRPAASLPRAYRRNSTSVVRPASIIHIRHILEHYFEETGSDDVVVEGHITGIASGFDRLDSLLGGLQRSDMIVLAARPSMGKSSLALRMARNIAVDRKGCVAVFSLEMSKEQIVQRLLSAESGLDTKRLRVSRHNYDEERRIMDASGVLAEARIYIDDTPSPKIAELRSKARRLHYDQGLDLLIIDYLQLIHGSGKPENRVQEISDISRSIKAIARELNVPVIAVSQLSRAVEQRTPHVPLLSDLRESGSIEQDADIVLFIYRADVYYTQEEWERQNPDQEYPEGVATVIVAKHRNGPTGQIDLRFTKSTAKFDNFEPQGAELVTQQALPRISV
ncbi:MAG: replicative DNA helicase, partial [Chloroflexota bacterium]|nr:replicative DNA helicase [Chloroflexota bacterium]